MLHQNSDPFGAFSRRKLLRAGGAGVVLTAAGAFTGSHPALASPSAAACGATGWDVISQSGGLPGGFAETSGIAASRLHNGFYGVGDSGSPASLYWFTPNGGSQTAFNGRMIPVSGAANSDWECLKYTLETFDGGQTWFPYVYIHDNMGNSSTKAKRLIKVHEPADPSTATSAVIDWTAYWRWPSGLSGSTCGNYHNTEAIAIIGGRLYAVRKKQASQAEVADVGPLSQLSRDASSPTTASVIGTIGHSCPSEFAFSADMQRLITVSHGEVRVWGSTVGGGSVAAFLTGSNTLVFQHQPGAINGAANNTETATWWPWDSCDFLVASESRNTYRYTATA